MNTSTNLDEFLKSQSSGFTATLEAVPDKPTAVKVTPFRDEHGCGCSSSFELARSMIRSVTPTGKFHFCCGKRLEVVVVEFTENASVPVADLINRGEHPNQPMHAAPHHHHAGGHSVPRDCHPFQARAGLSGASASLVGRWPIPWTPCTLTCIEVCTEFCSDTGWDCCRWETRCGINCNGFIA